MKRIAAGPLCCIVALAAALGGCKPSVPGRTAPERDTEALVVPAVPPPPSAQLDEEVLPPPAGGEGSTPHPRELGSPSLGASGAGESLRTASPPRNGPVEQRPSVAQRQEASPVSAEARREFVAAAAEAGLAETEAARLAAMRTSSATVKALAAQIEADQARIHDELRGIARDEGIDVPATVAGDLRAALDDLAAESGGEFDRRYVRDFGVEAQRKAIALFERQARAGEDAALRAFAQRSLPLLLEHLAAAQQLQGEPS